MTGSTTGAPTGTTTAAACSNLHPFIDGELDEADAAAFRQHLGVCATCPGELEAAVLADAVAEAGLGVQLGAAARVTDAAAPAPAHAVATAATNGGAATTDVARGRSSPHPSSHSSPSSWRPTAWRWALPGALTLAAAAALILWARTTPESDNGGALAVLIDDGHRSVDARLSYPGLDRHRPLRRERGGKTSAWVDGREQTLADLEKQGDEHGLAVASLIEGRKQEAEAHLRRAPESPAVLSDAAAIAIERGDGASAEAFAKRALAQQPQHPQAMWNLAVALQLQGQHAEAAKAFTAVAALGEPGWSQEAGQRAAALTPSPP